MLTDPIADMLSRIRNANRAMHDTVAMPTSRMKEEIARLLQDEGYIKGFSVVEAEPVSSLVIELKFGKNRERVITDLKRVSKPGRRVYACTLCFGARFCFTRSEVLATYESLLRSAANGSPSAPRSARACSSFAAVVVIATSRPRIAGTES